MPQAQTLEKFTPQNLGVGGKIGKLQNGNGVDSGYSASNCKRRLTCKYPVTSSNCATADARGRSKVRGGSSLTPTAFKSKRRSGAV